MQHSAEFPEFNTCFYLYVVCEKPTNKIMSIEIENKKNKHIYSLENCPQ